MPIGPKHTIALDMSYACDREKTERWEGYFVSLITEGRAHIPERFVLHAVSHCLVASGSDEFVKARDVAGGHRLMSHGVDIHGFFAEVVGREASAVFLDLA